MEPSTNIAKASWLLIVKRFYSSGWYPLLLAVLAALSFCTQKDLLFVSFAILLTAFGLVVADDLKPLLPMMLYFCFFICLTHSPSRQAAINPVDPAGGASQYYQRPEVIKQLIVLAVILLAAYAVNALRTHHLRRLLSQRTSLLFWSVPLSILLLVNGLGAPAYDLKNLLIGFVTVFCWIFLYLLYYHGLKKDRQTRIFFLQCCAAAAMALIVQIAYVYFAYHEKIFLPNSLDVYYVRFGWGIKNNFGGMMALLLPACFYLAAKEKAGPLYYLLGVLSYAAIVMSFSRSALLVGSVVFLLCLISVCAFGRHKRLYRVFFLCALLGGALFLTFSLQESNLVFQHYINKALDDSNRFDLWKNGFEQFLQQPLLGVGVYSIEFSSWSGIGMPGYLHNTPLQLLVSGGVLCLLAYLAYRARTLMLFLRKPTAERLFLGLMLLSLLGTSLLDNHMFNIYPAFYYAAILALAEHDCEEKTHTL